MQNYYQPSHRINIQPPALAYDFFGVESRSNRVNAFDYDLPLPDPSREVDPRNQPFDDPRPPKLTRKVGRPPLTRQQKESVSQPPSSRSRGKNPVGRPRKNNPR